MSRKVLVIDYGMGNVRSVSNALSAIGCEPIVSSNPSDALRADGFVLPGVGAYGEAMRNLKASGMADALSHEVLTRGKPILGVCLGMQLLGESSEEGGFHEGLGWIPAKVTALPQERDLRVPHMGWNDVAIVKPDPLFSGTAESRTYYFAHSYVFSCAPELVSATFDYGGTNVAAFQRDNIFGTQFHPERSSEAGSALLRNFASRIGL
jgi:glutamine amidotransferase